MAAGAGAGAARSPRSRRSRPTTVVPGRRPGPGTNPGSTRVAGAHVVAHPHILPERRAATDTLGPIPCPAPPRRSLRSRAYLRRRRHGRHRPPPGDRPRRGRSRGHGVLPPRREGGRPGRARRRAGGRRRLRRRVVDTGRAGRSARGGHQPADEPGPVGQPDRRQARLRPDQPAAARGCGNPRAGRRRGRGTPRRRAEHLVRLPAGTRRAHRGRPAVDRCRRPDRPADEFGGGARVGHAGRRRARAAWSCATAPSTVRAPTWPRAASTPPCWLGACCPSPVPAAASSACCTSTTRCRPPSPRSTARPASSTWSTTCPRRRPSGCRWWRACWAPSRRVGSPSRWPASGRASSSPTCCAISRQCPTGGRAPSWAGRPVHPDWHEGLPAVLAAPS